MGRTCVVHDAREQARHRLASLLRAHGDLDEVVVATDVDDLVGLAREGSAVLVVLGVPRSGAAQELVGRVREAAPGVPVLLAGPSDEPALVAAALGAGAAGYLCWDAPRTMTRTLARLTTGEDLPVGDDEVQVDRSVQLALDLSVREIQVLVGVSRGLTNADIGRRLYLSAATVKSHTGRLFRKLGATDRAEAVGRAWQLGVLVRAPAEAVGLRRGS